MLRRKALTTTSSASRIMALTPSKINIRVQRISCNTGVTSWITSSVEIIALAPWDVIRTTDLYLITSKIRKEWPFQTLTSS